jgi:hypothetical protein
MTIGLVSRKRCLLVRIVNGPRLVLSWSRIVGYALLGITVRLPDNPAVIRALDEYQERLLDYLTTIKDKPGV